MSIYTCEEHDAAVVVHEGVKCPVCETIDDLTTELETAQHEAEGPSDAV